MSVSIDITSSGTRSELKVSGEVDVSNADTLRENLNQTLAQGAELIEVDIADVPYIDSTGIGVLVGAAHRAQEKGAALRIVHPQRNVARVFSLLGVDRELSIDTSELA